MYVRVGPALALGLLAGAPLFAQSPGTSTPSPPNTLSTEVTKVVGLPLPEKYAQKFGTDANAARTATQILLNRNASREDVAEALDAVTYYGHEGGRAVAAFAGFQIRRNQVEHAGDTSWYVPIADAMIKVPDARAIGPLLHWTRYGEDPILRAKALKALSAMVANAAYDLPTGDGDGQTIRVSGTTADQGWRSLGQSITLDQRDAIKAMAQRVLADAQTPQSVRREAEALMWWVKTREEQDQKVLESRRAMQNGEPLPPGTGGGGFGTPPAE